MRLLCLYLYLTDHILHMVNLESCDAIRFVYPATKFTKERFSLCPRGIIRTKRTYSVESIILLHINIPLWTFHCFTLYTM